MPDWLSNIDHNEDGANLGWGRRIYDKQEIEVGLILLLLLLFIL